MYTWKDRLADRFWPTCEYCKPEGLAVAIERDVDDGYPWGVDKRNRTQGSKYEQKIARAIKKYKSSQKRRS